MLRWTYVYAYWVIIANCGLKNAGNRDDLAKKRQSWKNYASILKCTIKKVLNINWASGIS